MGIEMEATSGYSTPAGVEQRYNHHSCLRRAGSMTSLRSC